ncbi:L-fuculose phosphate aldolase [Blastochloris viridis]|nr:L-fuculose phosphate aldolase [Blastochloris viridis]CUU43676.1 L-fuculose phosphate aldolase [Blastochloris viridis]
MAMVAAGLSRGSSGNVSARLTGDMFLVTPSGVPYANMTAEMIVRADLDGGYWGDLLPSTEWRLHAEIYRARPEAGGVVHAHPTHASALACLRRDIPAFHYMVAAAGGDSVRCACYATVASAELAAAMMAALAGRTACLLANHGAVTLGRTADAALNLMAEIEQLAEQYAIAASLGAPVLLDDDEMARVSQVFAGYGRQAGASAVSGVVRRG